MTSTEFQKMIAGQLYDASAPELVAARTRARDLLQALNASRESERCDYGSNIELGESVFFNFNCVVLDVCPVRIGSFTQFGPGVQLYTASHPLNAALRREQEFGKPIDIGSDVWVGGGAIILPGVRIGSGAVIGAGSVVTRDVPPGVIAAGNPCRVLRAIED
jgi:maltose O-acetyltransferase